MPDSDAAPTPGTSNTDASTGNAPAANATSTNATSANVTEVYAIHGADPEVLAYAMAKYSRSSLTLRESLREISSQRAEQFLNTFYFQYGHRSIADLAHVAFAVERLSLLAAIALVDEPRWDGQERSTRYQDFHKSGFYTPHFDTEAETAQYTGVMRQLFDSYEAVASGMLEELKAHTPRPATMDEGSYTRTLRARAFDMARYLLPLATNTSLGQITNARTLEGQISRLLGSDYAEIRELGEKLREAAAGPAWNSNHADARSALAVLAETNASAREALEAHMLREVKVSPTLVKYTAPSEYAARSRASLRQAARELMRDAAIEAMPVDSPNVELIKTSTGERLTLEIDLATSLLYPQTHYRYAQLRAVVASLAESRILELVALGMEGRGKHDELPRAFAAANGLRFDILMDIGGFRDMHRHRRCVQLLQPYTAAHGYETPDFPGQPRLTSSRVAEEYRKAMQAAFGLHAQLTETTLQENNPGSDTPVSETLSGLRLRAHSMAPVPVPQFRAEGVQMEWGSPLPRTSASGPLEVKGPSGVRTSTSADYLLPLATRCRSLFTMDFAQAVYMSELRSTPAGHWSYRNVAWQMYRQVARIHPALARHFRMRDPHEPVDLLQR